MVGGTRPDRTQAHHLHWVKSAKATLAGLEPATLRFEVLRAIHCATGPMPMVPVGFEPTPTNVDSNLSRAP